MGKEIRQKDVDLFAAASAGDLARVAALLAAGANPGYADATYGYTPLHQAAESGHVEIVRRLVETSESDPRDEHDHTPLMLAAYNGHEGVAKVLLEAGADPRLADKDGLSSVTVARDEDWEELADLLQEKAEALTEEDLRKLAVEEEEAAREREAAEEAAKQSEPLAPLAEEGEEKKEGEEKGGSAAAAAAFHEAVYSALDAALAPSAEGGDGARGVPTDQLAVAPGRTVLLEQLGMELAKVMLQIQGLDAPDERKYVVAAARAAASIHSSLQS